ncbi:hypothetical protein [Amycolatopsis magusensis]|uniref:hypothetical protein n=1 Tax=Amycolatopsis magusensis TaxID=882444 RepID=UPI003C2F50A1
MSSVDRVGQLLRGIEDLSDNQLKILASVANALKVPVDFVEFKSSDLATADFVETMANLLTLHHALHEAPLSKKPFEYSFKNCLLAQDSKAQLNPSPGDSAYDVSGLGQRWSLKTEAAKGISSKTVRIEKFMEARWVRECSSPEQCAHEVRNRVPAHMTGYDRIVVLRAFPKGDFVEYSLDEVPKSLLLDCFGQAKAEQFEKKGRSISFGADFYIDGPQYPKKAFRLLLDSSVEKLRLWYELSHVIRHGVWRVRASEIRTAQQNSSVP